MYAKNGNEAVVESFYGVHENACGRGSDSREYGRNCSFDPHRFAPNSQRPQKIFYHNL